MKKNVILYLLITLIIIFFIFGFVYLLKRYVFVPSIVQVNAEGYILPSIKPMSGWIQLENIAFTPKNCINTDSRAFEIDCNNIIKIKECGIYNFTFTVSGFIHLDLPINGILQTNTEDDTPVDFTVEWKVDELSGSSAFKTSKSSGSSATVLSGLTTPAYSNNRTDGVEGVNTLSKMLSIDRVPVFYGICYRNPEPEQIITNYTLNMANLSIQKVL